MAKTNSLWLLSLSLGLLLLFNGCMSKQDWSQQQGECQIQRINAAEPNGLVPAEGGQTEFWDQNDEQFRCAGVAVRRHTIHRQGLLLPSYTNAPLLVYIIQGKGILGIMAPGCAETFQTSQQSFEQQGRRESEESSRQDQHQRIQHFRQGDIIAIPAGAAHWTYNNGEEDLISVVLFDTTNNDNQLDQNPRRFFIAGNVQEPQQWRHQTKSRQSREQQGSRHSQEQQGSRSEWRNVFAGFETRTLAIAFGVPEETARKLQGEQDNRGHIVRVESGFQVLTPPSRQDQSRRPENGIEETVCSARLIENLDDPSRADIYNPQAGRLSTVNSYNLPVLSWLKLSAERGVLKRNAMMSPYWSVNSHKIIYVTRGDARIQIVNENGEAVFDDEVREGQIVVAPQNFAVLKQAGNRGFDWVAFRTNENAVINTLAGRNSALRGLPVDVVSNAYQVSREEAQKLKSNRQETLLFASSGSESGRIASA